MTAAAHYTTKLGSRAYSYWLPSGAEKFYGASALAVAGTAAIVNSVGVSWVPVIGPAWDKMGVADPEAGFPNPQYPARAENGSAWNAFYFFTYGAVGLYAQSGAYKVSTAPIPYERMAIAPAWMVKNARILGGFHLAMWIHHVVCWISSCENHGFHVQDWNVPCPTLQATALSTWVGWHGACLLWCGGISGKATFFDIRRRVVMMNMSAMCAGTAGAFFMLENLIGKRNATAESLVEQFAFGGPLSILLMDALILRKF